MFLCVVSVGYCAMLYGMLFLFVCLCVLFHGFVGVVLDLLCGGVWLGVVCVVIVCVFSLF